MERVRSAESGVLVSLSPANSSLGHFTIFKQNVYKAALVALKTSDPEYWGKYVKDPAGVLGIRADKGLPKQWQEIMETLVSYELQLEQVKLALKLLDRPCPLPDNVCTEGQWADYNFESWLNAAYSWMEKLESLVKRIIRQRGKDLGRKSTPQKVLEEKLKEVRQKFKYAIRGRYVHGTGAVSGISEGPGWEFSVAAQLDVAAHPRIRYHVDSIGRRENRHQWLQNGTAQQLANIEELLSEINEALFPSTPDP
ncbi:MAG: hypothetical protein V1724_07675 [Chloroflexota bacterium]